MSSSRSASRGYDLVERDGCFVGFGRDLRDGLGFGGVPRLAGGRLVSGFVAPGSIAGLLGGRFVAGFVGGVRLVAGVVEDGSALGSLGAGSASGSFGVGSERPRPGAFLPTRKMHPICLVKHHLSSQLSLEPQGGACL